MNYNSLEVGNDFRYDEDAAGIDELQRFLYRYELDTNLDQFLDGAGYIDIKDILDVLPKQTEEGLSSAAKELSDYYYAVPRNLRASGVKMKPKQLLSLLMNRTEFYHDLASSLVRVCRGTDCTHYDACPFRHLKTVQEARVEDGIECMVDRKVVSGMIEAFIEPKRGRPKVDPDQPAQMLLFEQLVQLVVKQRRIMMTMQVQKVLTKRWEVLKHKDTERFASKNYMTHPLMEAWKDTHQRIESALKQMGISPEFEMRQDTWEAKDDRIDSDERAQQLLLERLEQATKMLKDSDDPELDEKVSKREAFREALLSVRKRQQEGGD